MSTLCISSLSGGPQAVLRVDFGALVFFVALLANIGVALVAVQDPRPPDTAPGSRSAILTEQDALLPKEVVVTNQFGR